MRMTVSALLSALAVLAIFGESQIAEPAYNWEPENEHRCNIQKFDKLQLEQHFPNGVVPPLFPEPFVLVASKPEAQLDNQIFRQKTSLENILTEFPANFTVSLSSSNALSEHYRETSLAQYIQETVDAGVTLPDKNSSDNWYLFGHTYSSEWQELTSHYKLPPCKTCQPDLCALSFGIGNRGSGVQWHVHGPGFSEALHGRKHWVLYPRQQKPQNYHKDQSSRQWMEFVYPIADPKPYECTLNPGDLIYFPDEWWHATINLDPYTAFISTFTTEHGIARDEL